MDLTILKGLKMADIKNGTKQQTPLIGIFWLQYKDSRFSLFHSVSYRIENGIEYGDFIIAKEAHYETWESLKTQNMVPKRSEYDDIPRGRVLYNRVLNQYKVFSGTWINRSIKSVIATAFKLPKSGVIWDTDEHYNRFKGLTL
jgi:hypothetical protein